MPTRSFLILLFAILSEIIGTTALKRSMGLTRLGPSVIVVVAYAITFFLLSLALKTIPVNVAYAIWAGLGTAGIALVGWFFFQEAFTIMSAVGIGFIIAGVVILHFSGTLKP